MKTIVFGAAIALMFVCLLPFYSATQFIIECNETNISNETVNQSKFSEFLIDQRKNCSNESALINSSVNASLYALDYSATLIKAVVEIKDYTGWTNRTGSRRWDCEDMVCWTNRTGSRILDWGL